MIFNNSQHNLCVLTRADRISILRTAMIFVVSLMAYYVLSPAWLAVLLLLVAFALDFIDGIVARSFHESSVHGSLLDVMGDRITEIVLWLTFLYFQMVPLWAPIIVLSRAVITDAVRAKAAAVGTSVYGMIQTKLGRALVKSRISRGLYGSSKALFFLLLLLQRYSLIHLSNGFIFWYSAYLAVYSIMRGAPVLFEAKRFVSD